MRTGTVVLAALVAALLQACGGSGAVPLADLAEQDLAAQCAVLARCGAITNEGACRDLLRPLVAASMSELAAAAANGTVSYDGEKAAACLDWLRAQSCDQTSAAVRVVPAACNEAVKGTVAPGAACAVSEQCVSGACLHTNCGDSCCPGSCAPIRPAPAAAGESCSGRACAEGSFCGQGNQTCTALKAEGAACDGSEQCAYGTFCAGTSAQVCTKAPAEGGACAGGRCGSTGLTCDTSNHCAKNFGLGAACTPQRPGCAYDLICDPSSSKCAARPGAGAACVNGSCGAGSYCVYGAGAAGVCAALKANGQACAEAHECQSESCQGKLCADAGACVKK